MLEKKIGDFKPKRKFVSFVSAISGARVRLIRDSAYLDGGKLSGMLEDVRFKITIHDNGTIDFIESGTNSLNLLSDNSELLIQRLIDDIDNMKVVGYAQKFIVSNLEFKDEDGSLCYLEVEHAKPVDRFNSLLDGLKEDVDKSLKNSISERGMSVLDSLFSDIVEEVEDEKIEVSIDKELEKDQENKSSVSKSYIEQEFIKMNRDKVEELKKRITESKIDISKYKMESRTAEKKIAELENGLKVLESRLESMSPGESPNGYVFFISEEQKSDIGLSEDHREVVGKISKLMGLKEAELFNQLTEGFYNIRITKSDMINDKEFILDKEILEKLESTGIDLIRKEDYFVYRGELNWHQLVNKMIRSGFEQSAEFDKICQSNSYDSKFDNV